jgi:hypothetical protein
MVAVLLVACAASIASGAQTNPEQQALPSAASNPPAPSGNQVICKRTKVLGSHFKQKLCKTREDWDRIRDAGKREYDSINRSELPGQGEGS